MALTTQQKTDTHVSCSIPAVTKRGYCGQAKGRPLCIPLPIPTEPWMGKGQNSRPPEMGIVDWFQASREWQLLAVPKVESREGFQTNGSYRPNCQQFPLWDPGTELGLGVFQSHGGLWSKAVTHPMDSWWTCLLSPADLWTIEPIRLRTWCKEIRGQMERNVPRPSEKTRKRFGKGSWVPCLHFSWSSKLMEISFDPTTVSDSVKQNSAELIWRYNRLCWATHDKHPILADRK